MSELFKKIKSEEDLEWAFPEAKGIYLKTSPIDYKMYV
jgi:hypothetical protein